MLRLIDPTVRKELGVRTFAECEAARVFKSEREFQDQIEQYLRLHGVKFVHRSRMDKRTTGHFETQQVALDKAEQALSLRLEAMNEFRDQITQERALYVTRDQLDLSMKIVTTTVQPIQTAQTLMRGRETMLLSIVTLALAIGALVLPLVFRWHQ